MKKNLLFLSFFVCLASQIWMGHAVGPGKVQGKERTGSPVADGTCGNCHIGGAYKALTKLTFTDANNNPVTKYKSGQTYNLNILVTGEAETIGGSPAVLFGFQGIALNNQNQSTGVFTIPSIVQTVKIGGRDVIEHKTPKGFGSWDVTWTAPPKNTGAVKFYFCGNAANGGNGSAGDKAAPVLLTLEEATATIEDLGIQFLRFNNLIVGERLSIDYFTEKTSDFTFNIYDINGNILYSQKQRINQGEANTEINLSNLPNGLFILSIQNGDKLISKKFVKN
jgi:hypothetical protein